MVAILFLEQHQVLVDATFHCNKEDERNFIETRYHIVTLYCQIKLSFQWLVSVGHTRDKSRNCPWYFYHLCKVVLYPYGHARQPSALHHLCKYNTQ